MISSDAVGLFAGAILLGIVHGVEPGHGWPVAASYALDQTNKWLYGFAASFILGLGHLVSSIAMVVVFFLAKQYFELTQVNEPIPIDIFSTTIFLGGPVSLFAGVLLVGLGIREYFHGHSHDHGGDGHDHSHGHGGDHDHSHDESDGQRYHIGATPDYAGSHDHDAHEHESHDHPHGHDDDHSHGHDEHGHRHSHDHSHSHDHADDDSGVLAKLKLALPFVGGHSHGSAEDASERGLWGIAGFAFVLGFAHEEEFEIIAMCAGSEYCLSLMTVYALTVIAGIVALTLLLIAGYEHYEERVERYTDYLPLFSAVVLILMGLGFIVGLF
ncbi:hypothetical protein [Halorussus halophilus]|uniref:hypothetical protein n=1 Tax=Halorussus halophilus TaxID=2650975 RepID=UPI001301733F|nr:hypothetical protein [Halorussus halophilus]